MDLSSGRFLVNEVDRRRRLEAELARLEPAEMLVPGRRHVARSVMRRTGGARGRRGCSTPTPAAPAAAVLRLHDLDRLRHRGSARARSPPPGALLG
jgi:hypothetical protein